MMSKSNKRTWGCMSGFDSSDSWKITQLFGTKSTEIKEKVKLNDQPMLITLEENQQSDCNVEKVELNNLPPKLQDENKIQKNKKNKKYSNDHIKFLDIGSMPWLSIAVVYLMFLGTVGELREKFNIDLNIPDYYSVLKYGQSENLYQRYVGLRRIYPFIKLLLFCIVDPEYLREGENEVKHHYKLQKLTVDKSFRDEGHTELFILNLTDKDEYNNLKQFYELVRSKYTLKVFDIKKQLDDLKHEKIVSDLNHQISDLKHEKIVSDLKYGNKLLKIKAKKLKLRKLNQSVNIQPVNIQPYKKRKYDYSYEHEYIV
jgi:hypothetical protein